MEKYNRLTSTGTPYYEFEKCKTCDYGKNGCDKWYDQLIGCFCRLQELEDKIDNKEIYFKDDVIDIFLNTFIKVVKPKLKEYFPSLNNSSGVNINDESFQIREIQNIIEYNIFQHISLNESEYYDEYDRVYKPIEINIDFRKLAMKLYDNGIRFTIKDS